MPAEENIKFTIQTEADTKGAEEAVEAVDKLKQELEDTGKSSQEVTQRTEDNMEAFNQQMSKLEEILKTLDEHITQLNKSLLESEERINKSMDKPKAGLEKVTKAAKETSSSIEDLAKKAEATGNSVKSSALMMEVAFSEVGHTVQGLDKIHGDSVRTIENFGKSGSQAVEKYKGEIKSLLPVLVDFGKSGKKSSEETDNSLKEIMKTLQLLKTGWRTAATAMSGVFGAIGLITGAVSRLKQAYEYLNREQIAAEKKKQEEFQNTKDHLQELGKAINTMAAKELISSYTYLDRERMAEDIRQIDEKTAALNKQIDAQLRQDKTDRHRRLAELDREELQLQADYKSGKVTQSELIVRQEEIKQDRLQIGREGGYKEMELIIEKLDNATSALDEIVNKQSGEIGNREKDFMDNKQVKTAFETLSKNSVKYQEAMKQQEIAESRRNYFENNGTTELDKAQAQRAEAERAEAESIMTESNRMIAEAIAQLKAQMNKVSPGLDVEALGKELSPELSIEEMKKFEKELQEATTAYKETTKSMINERDKNLDESIRLSEQAENMESNLSSKRSQDDETQKTEDLQMYLTKEEAARTAEIEKRKEAEAALQRQLDETEGSAKGAEQALGTVKNHLLDLANMADGMGGGGKFVTDRVRAALLDNNLSEQETAELENILSEVQTKMTARTQEEVQLRQTLTDLLRETLGEFALAANVMSSQQSTVNSIRSELQSVKSSIQTLQSQQQNK